MALVQTKSYEDLLGDALEALLAERVDDLEEFVRGLNEQQVQGPAGERWTVELLSAELARLGA